MWGKKFIGLLLIFLITFLSFLFLIFNSSGLLLKFEILLFLIILFASFIVLLGVYVEERWSWTLSFFVFIIILIDTFLLRYFVGGHFYLYSITFIAGLIGFLFSLANMGRDKEPRIVPYEAEKPALETYGENKTEAMKEKLKVPKRKQSRKRKK